MITLKRKSGVSLQAGDDSYVFLFWKKHKNCQAIVSIETSRLARGGLNAVQR